jgi:hypothetical protein
VERGQEELNRIFAEAAQVRRHTGRQTGSVYFPLHRRQNGEARRRAANIGEADLAGGG